MSPPVMIRTESKMKSPETTKNSTTDQTDPLINMIAHVSFPVWSTETAKIINK